MDISCEECANFVFDDDEEEYVCCVSMDEDDIRMSDEVYDAFHKLRKFMFERVYTNPVAKGQESKVEDMIKILYQYYLDHIDKIPDYLKRMMEEGVPKGLGTHQSLMESCPLYREIANLQLGGDEDE